MQKSTKELLLIVGLLAGAYLLFKKGGGLLDFLSGGAGGGGWTLPDFDLSGNGSITPDVSAAAPTTDYRYDYSAAPTIPVSNIVYDIPKRINVLRNISNQTNIPQLRTVTQRAIEFEKKKQTIGVLQNIRDKTINPQLRQATEKILTQLPGV